VHLGLGGVLTHVGSDEHPLGELVGFEILLEHGGVLDKRKTLRIGGDRVVENRGAECWSV
jgi:hypothetical protein